MYKITLFDYNCASCTSGTASFYVDDIDIFEEKWSKLETSPERIERFRHSKNGEVVTDYYSDDEELNIVQEDKAADLACLRQNVQNRQCHTEANIKL